jgi:uncharacterized iron-regulated membrane protein
MFKSNDKEQISMKLFRKILFWCHLIVGVTAGIVVLIMSVTGVLLTYEKQMIAWADTRNYHVARPTDVADRLSVEAMLDKARQARPNATPTTFVLQSDPSAPAAIGFGREGNLYINPYTSAVLGEGSKTVREFFHVVTDWHRWLGMEGAGRATGRAITGACNLGFLFLVLSGFYLWWPRQWTWSQFKNVLWFKRGLPGKARDFNWHNVIGLWSVALLFIIVLSGVVISYQWAGNLVYRVVGENPPGPPARSNAGSAPGAAASQSERRGEGHGVKGSPLEGLNQLLTRAEKQTSGWKTISLRLPATAEAPLTFTIDQGNAGQPHKRSQLTLDRKSGEVVRWEQFSSYSSGRKLRSILRFSHTGEIGGIIGQTIAGIVSLGACFLVWTGLALAWQRFRAWKSRQAPVPVQATPRLEEVIGD